MEKITIRVIIIDDMSPENKEILVKRLKSLVWTVGTFAALATLNYISENIGLVGLPMWAVTIISLVVNQITKQLNTQSR